MLAEKRRVITLCASPGHPAALVSFHEALGYWLKLGFISFGGPAGQIAIMHQELVEPVLKASKPLLQEVYYWEVSKAAPASGPA